MAIDNLAQANAEIEKLWKRLERVERGAPNGFSSVSRGTTRFIGNESLKVLGSQLVSGWLIITGTLKVVGAFLLEGATTMTGNLISSGTALFTGAFTSRGTTRFEGDTSQVGPFHVTGTTDITGPSTTVTGPFHVSGNQDNTGTLDIGGVTTLRKNLNVVTGGAIVAGGLTITPTGELVSPTNLVVTTPRLALSADLRVAGSITNPGIPSTSSGANAFINLVGELQKVGSAARLKIDAVPMGLPDSLLSVPVKHWIDLGNAERFAALYTSPRPFTQRDQLDFDGADLRRISGVIAEEVRDAGGDSFVNYDEAGEVQGVAYDRFALARTEVLARQVEVLRAELALLRASIS